MSDELRSCDVLIIGASMAGTCLARQLKLKHPELDIVVIDRKREFGHWVGESTLEVFWDYATRHLDLGPYLDKHHLFKHGLRFFFDSEAHDLPLDQMSEFGRTWYHSVPAHQLDRKRFDSDLYAMNVKSGIDMRLGEKVNDIDLDREAGHRVHTSHGTYRCRWLVDAGGFAAPLARKLGIVRSHADRHPVSSYWGRFKGLADMDLQGDLQWRAKVNHTSRVLATNHFMYRGYWIWLIPLNAETTSLGVTVREDMRDDIQPKNGEELLAFLREHASFRQLLGPDASVEDFHALKSLPRSVEQAYSEDRWFITGMASSVIEPLLSPGCAHLADANRMIGDLIATDLAGESRAFREKTLVYSAYTRFWFEAALSQVQGLYTGFFDIHMAFFQPSVLNYFGVILPTSMSERWGYEPGSLPEDAKYEDILNAAMAPIGEGTEVRKVEARAKELEAFLMEHGVSYENNRQQFFDSESPPPVMHHTVTNGRDLSLEEIIRISQYMYEFCLTYSLKRMAEVAGFSPNPDRLSQVVQELTQSDRSLEDGLAALAAAPVDAAASQAAAMPASAE